MLLSYLFVDEPAGHFAVVDCVHQVLSADDVSSSVNVRLVLVLHSRARDHDLTIVVPHKLFNGCLSIFGTEGADDEICLHVDGLAGQFVLLTFEEILFKLERYSLSVVFDDLLGSEVGHKVDALID